MVVGWKFVFLLCIWNSLVLFQTQIFGRPRVLKLPETSGLMAFNTKSAHLSYSDEQFSIKHAELTPNTSDLRRGESNRPQSNSDFSLNKCCNTIRGFFSFTCLVCRFLLGLLFSMHLEAWNSILCFRIMRRFLSFD